jgi:hypothetical protein
MKITLKELREIIRKEFQVVNEEEKPEGPATLDPGKSSGINKAVQRLTDPDTSAQKFMKLDKMMQQRGNDLQKAQAIAAFAINYANDGNIGPDDIQGVLKLLSKAREQATRILKSHE